jgi:hypothetical protein
MRLKRSILLCLFGSIAFSSVAQDETSVKRIWSDIHIAKQINHDFSAKVKLSYFNVFPHYASRFIDVGMNYGLTNNLVFGLYYRFQGDFETASRRFYIESSYKNLKIKLLGIKVEPRIRLQHRLYENEAEPDFHSYQIRSRILLKKRLDFSPNVTLYTSTESFRSTTIEKKMRYNRLRFDFGIRYEVPNTQHQIRVSYRQQLDIDGEEKEVSGMISTGYSFRF